MSAQEKTKAESKLSKVITLKDAAIAAPEKRASAKQFATWIRALMQNWRQGTVAVKDRSEVARTNKKPWKQKGTGRARAGSARSPLWRGGGVTFGPQARVKQLRINKKLKQQILHTLAADFIENKKVHCVDWILPNDTPKTKLASELLKNIGLHNKRVVLFLAPDNSSTYASFINIPQVQVIWFDQPNAFDLAHAEHWLYLKNDQDAFKEMVGKWHN